VSATASRRGGSKPKPDEESLDDLLQVLVGQPFLGVKFIYGDELIVDFGPGRRVEDPVFGRTLEPDFWLGTLATDWLLLSSDSLVARSEDTDREETARTFEALKGSHVGATDVRPDLALTIAFSSGHKLLVLPRRAMRTQGLPYWDLLLPESRMIEAGPGRKWSVENADLPPKERGRSSRADGSGAPRPSRTR